MRADQSVEVLTLDGATLRPRASASIGRGPDEILQGTVVPGAGHEAVVAVSAGYDRPSLSLWALDGGRLVAAPAPPAGRGLAIAPAGPTEVYVYGGPARNTVGRLDLASGRFTADVPDLRAPAGTWIVGLA